MNKKEDTLFHKDDVLEVTITDIGNEGEGIGKVDGYTLFIKDAVIGDVVKAKIMKAKKNYAYAHLEGIVTPSPYRIEPKCRVARQCGGCQLQFMSYEKQLEFKAGKVRNNIIRLGGFDAAQVDAAMEEILAMDNPFRYRNKAQFPIGTGRNGQPVTGFYAERSHDIIPSTECYIGTKENQQILQTILDYMKANQVPAYDEVTGRGTVRHVLIRKGFASGEIMVCLVINSHVKGGDYLRNQQAFITALRQIKGMTSISVSINNEKTNVIMGAEIHTL